MAAWTLSPTPTKMYGIFDLETNEPVTNPSLDKDKMIGLLKTLDHTRWVLVETDAVVYRMQMYPEGLRAL